MEINFQYFEIFPIFFEKFQHFGQKYFFEIFKIKNIFNRFWKKMRILFEKFQNLLKHILILKISKKYFCQNVEIFQNYFDFFREIFKILKINFQNPKIFQYFGNF